MKESTTEYYARVGYSAVRYSGLVPFPSSNLSLDDELGCLSSESKDSDESLATEAAAETDGGGSGELKSGPA